MNIREHEKNDLITINEAINETGRSRRSLNTWIQEGVINLHIVNGVRMISKKQCVLIHKSKRKMRSKKRRIVEINGEGIITRSEAVKLTGLSAYRITKWIENGEITDYRKENHDVLDPVLVSKREIREMQKKTMEKSSTYSSLAKNDLVNLHQAVVATGRSKNTLRRWKRDGLIQDHQKSDNPNAPVLLSMDEILTVANKYAQATKDIKPTQIEIGKESLARSLIAEKIRELESSIADLELRLEKAEATTQRVFGFAQRLSNVERALVQASEIVQGPKGEIRNLI